MNERWSETTWTAAGTWRYSDMQSSLYDEMVSHTYKYKPTPEEARSDLQTDVINHYGHNTTVERICVCEVVTKHLFDA
jgi:hypothetical protein